MRGEGRQHKGGTLADASGEGERRPMLRHGGMRAAGVAAGRIAAPIVARSSGGMTARLKAEWLAVAGGDFAAAAWPETLGRDGALKLRVEPALALDVQHRAPLLIERINRYFGRDMVVRLMLVQAPRTRAPPAMPVRPRPIGGAEAEALDARLGDIADPELRAALSGLGRLVLGKDQDC
jgi:hypothetical protein